MKQYNTNNGILTLKLIPNYEIDNRIVVALVRNIENPNYYQITNESDGLTYIKSPSLIPNVEWNFGN